MFLVDLIKFLILTFDIKHFRFFNPTFSKNVKNGISFKKYIVVKFIKIQNKIILNFRQKTLRSLEKTYFKIYKKSIQIHNQFNVKKKRTVVKFLKLIVK